VIRQSKDRAQCRHRTNGEGRKQLQGRFDNRIRPSIFLEPGKTMETDRKRLERLIPPDASATDTLLVPGTA